MDTKRARGCLVQIGNGNENGNVYVKDGSEKYFLYERDHCEPESVKLGSSLKLNGPDRVIPASCGMHLYCRLYVQKKKSMLYMNDELDVDVEDNYGKISINKLEIKGYVVVLKYFVLPCARTVIVSVVLENKGPSRKNLNARELLACYDDTCELKKEEYEDTKIVLHNGIHEQLKRKTKSSLKLDCDYVAVPSYASSLIIKVVLDDGEEKAHSFKLSDQLLDEHTSYSVGNISLKVTVEWCCVLRRSIPIRQLPLREDRCLFYDDEPEVVDGFFRLYLQPVTADDVCSPILIKGCSRLMLEMFSIFIGLTGNQDVALFGSIKVVSATGAWYYLFHKDVDDPEVFSTSKKMLRIEGPSQPLLLDPSLKFKMDLKDTHGSLSIKGDYRWNKAGNYVSKCRNRPVADVYRGNYGYVAVHSMLISRAYYVSISIVVQAEGDIIDVAKHVRGSIYAYHGIYSYNTGYDEAFNRCLLFEGDDCAVELTVEQGKCKIPLRRTYVCLDYRSSLLLDIDVGIEIGKKDKTTEKVSLFKQEGVDFLPPSQGMSVFCEGEGKGLSLSISAAWYYPPSLKSYQRFPWLG